MKLRISYYPWSDLLRKSASQDTIY
jgi:hypothetical protein